MSESFLSGNLPVCTCLSAGGNLSACLSAYLSVCLLVCSFVCLFICLLGTNDTESIPPPPHGASLEGSSCTRGREATTKTKVLPRESLFGGHSDDLRVRTGKNGPQILVTPPRGPSGTENGVSGAHLWYEQIDDSKPHYHNYQPNSQQVII